MQLIIPSKRDDIKIPDAYFIKLCYLDLFVLSAIRFFFVLLSARTARTADRLAQLVEHQTAVREVAGSNLDRTNTQGLKITEEKVLPL